MARGWLLLVGVLIAALLVSPAPHKGREGEEEEHDKETSYLQKAWIWIKHAVKKVKGWAVGEHSLYNQVMSKLKENRTISVLGKQVTFTLPDPSSSSDVHWGSSLSSILHNLKKEPVLRVLLALYINIVIFIAVYGYLIARHIMLSINLKKAAQPEKERERRRQKERRKMVKKMAKESKGRAGINNPTMFSPPLSSEGGNDTIRSTDFEEEIVMDRFRTPRSGASTTAQLVEASVHATPNQTTSE
ncbi:hypothetical protein PENTCL1PPCAC_27154 [Pristionchus entomophagus]|uniref:Uncharacterized protein n=1 Tax=Pristionchus entomophagus TaxID=358040 RepID=A0AAV5UG30_9BILA|nr:hypothetical protein PENTCL1PPCAC_27154 [Pristionchus entomophagus]